MSTLAFVAHPQRAWWRRIVALAAQALARFESALAAERRRRLGIRQLQDLNDRLLEDICASRGEIAFAAAIGVTAS
jgi:uncharacterized protein YjiS (DUF1127 family)